MEAPPPSYDDVTRGAGGYTNPPDDSSSSKSQPSAPPSAPPVEGGDFAYGQQPHHGHRYIQHGHGPSSHTSSGSAAYGPPPHHTPPGHGGQFPHYTYSTVNATAPGAVQYAPGHVNPVTVGYQTTPQAFKERMKIRAQGPRRSSTGRSELVRTRSIKRETRAQKIRTGMMIACCIFIIVAVLIIAIVIAATL